MARESRGVTFITPIGQITLRLIENHATAICHAADTMKARYFIAYDGLDKFDARPIWGVFDMRTARRDTPYPGQWSIDDPIRTFPIECLDAAVMFALAKGDR